MKVERRRFAVRDEQHDHRERRELLDEPGAGDQHVRDQDAVRHRHQRQADAQQRRQRRPDDAHQLHRDHAAVAPIKINFQLAGSPAVAGYLQDNGYAFADRGNGLTYGWNGDYADDARDRNKNANQLLDTLMHLRSGATWSIDLANGTYNVKISVGDSQYATTHTVSANGVSVFNNVSLARTPFQQKTVQVTVTNGKLTLTTSGADRATRSTTSRFRRCTTAEIAKRASVFGDATIPVACLPSCKARSADDNADPGATFPATRGRGALRPRPVLLPQVPLLRLLQHHPADARADGRGSSTWSCARRRCGRRRRPTVRPRTVFFGGGTPTLLPLDEMRRLLAGLRERFDFSDVDEWTVEANPATVTLEYCRMLREAGVDRLSFGAQSFDPRELKTLERHHDPDDVPRSLEIARAAGFARLNVDLIYAIPGQTLESWSRSLEARDRAGHAAPLVLRPDVRAEHADRGEEAAGAADAGGGVARAGDAAPHARSGSPTSGCPPYEISNYAAAGRGVPAQPGLLDGRQLHRPGPVGGVARRRAGAGRTARTWASGKRAIEAGRSCRRSTSSSSRPRRRAGELAMLMLRLTRGLNFADFAARTGFDARALFARSDRSLRARRAAERRRHAVCGSPNAAWPSPTPSRPSFSTRRSERLITAADFLAPLRLNRPHLTADTH